MKCDCWLIPVVDSTALKSTVCDLFDVSTIVKQSVRKQFQSFVHVDYDAFDFVWPSYQRQMWAKPKELNQLFYLVAFLLQSQKEQSFIFSNSQHALLFDYEIIEERKKPMR